MLTRKEAWVEIEALTNDANAEALAKLRDEEIIELPTDCLSAISKIRRVPSHEKCR